MATREDHPQLTVLDFLFGEQILPIGSVQLLHSVKPEGVRPVLPLIRLPVEHVDRLIPRNPMEPSGRVVRYAFVPPVHHGLYQRILNHIFCKVQVRRAKKPRQDRDDLARLMAKKVVDKLWYLRGWVQSYAGDPSNLAKSTLSGKF